MRPVTDYDGLCDAMFHTIRQNAAYSGFVLIRMLDVLTKVVRVERKTDRIAALTRHAELVFTTGADNLTDPSARADLRIRWEKFQTVASGLGR